MHINNKYITFNFKKVTFGFWLYIMSDCILFASLFAMYIVLSNNFIEALSKNKDIFNLNLIFIETFFLLLSSLTCSTSIFYANTENLKKIKTWMSLTFILGLCFIVMELFEFHHLIINEYYPNRNAFFSSFYILIGTHGIHIIIGLIWIIIMIIQLIIKGLTHANFIRLQCLSIFWHFLDIIWICVFTEVYLIGAL